MKPIVRSAAARPYPVRILLARPRLLTCVLLGVAAWRWFPDSLAHQTVTRAIIGWNVGACLYLALAARMMYGSTQERMRVRAAEEDEGRVLVLVLVVAAALACVGAIVAELSVVKDLHGTSRYGHIALTILTIVSSWAFTHVMFALHYAHEYYGSDNGEVNGGLDFPGEGAPDYGDFVYFAFVIGTSGQTADVSFSSRRMRRTGTVHCVLAFVFNTTLIALTINIASGLF